MCFLSEKVYLREFAWTHTCVIYTWKGAKSLLPQRGGGLFCLRVLRSNQIVLNSRFKASTGEISKLSFSQSTPPSNSNNFPHVFLFNSLSCWQRYWKGKRKEKRELWKLVRRTSERGKYSCKFFIHQGLGVLLPVQSHFLAQLSCQS